MVEAPAARSSRNRPAGTAVVHDVSVTKTTYQRMLTGNLLPEIVARFPGAAQQSTTITVQQDIATPHRGAAASLEPAASALGCSLRVMNQPLN